MAGHDLVPVDQYHKSGKMTEAQRKETKARVLDAMGKTDNITQSVRLAGTSCNTFYKWLRTGFITQDELAIAKQAYEDSLREELNERVFEGQKRPLLSAGKVVLDEKGKPVWYSEKNDAILWNVAKHRLPEYQTVDKKEVTIHNQFGDIPSGYAIVLDSRELTTQEFETLKQIVTNIETRKNGTVVIDSTVAEEPV